MGMFKSIVTEICELYEKGESVLVIAEKVKMTVKTVEYVLKCYSVKEVL